MNKLNKDFYLTTPIYYVNGLPHIGHAYTSIAADCLARFKRLNNYKIKFLTGTDEHGQKVEKSASDAKLEPQIFVDQMADHFIKFNQQLQLTNDDFIRTTQSRHKKAATKFWLALKSQDHIYLSTYSGWYSIRDESFYQEEELIDGLAPTGAPVEWVEEPSYFFNLSKWQDKLLKWYDENPEIIMPLSRRNEVVNFVKSGLKDLSISRTSFNWGIKIPDDKQHIMYVWLDALTNYLSAIGYGDDEQQFKQFWPADIHLVGKDILRFHAVYWPAFLMAANLELPKKIIAHGWWVKDNQKMSKSLGNVIRPTELINKFGIDQLRYFLLREISFGKDANYSDLALINRVNSELANNIGNLFQRTLNLIYKNCQGLIPNFSYDKYSSIEELYQHDLLTQASGAFEQFLTFMDQLYFSEAIEVVVQLANCANKYIDQQAPWNLVKSQPDRMKQILYILAESLRYIAILLQAFVPNAAKMMLDQLNIPIGHRSFNALNKDYALISGTLINPPQIIFPRINKC